MAACGTDAGYQQHRRSDESPCEPCREAHRVYQRGLLQRPATRAAERRRHRLTSRALRELRRRHLAEYDQILTDLQRSDQGPAEVAP